MRAPSKPISIETAWCTPLGRGSPFFSVIKPLVLVAAVQVEGQAFEGRLQGGVEAVTVFSFVNDEAESEKRGEVFILPRAVVRFFAIKDITQNLVEQVLTCAIELFQLVDGCFQDGEALCLGRSRVNDL